MGNIAEFEKIRVQAPQILREAKNDIANFNQYLVMEQEFPNHIANNIKTLKSAIGGTRHVHNGLCYFSAKLSPIEIWSMAYAGFFYLPTFILAKLDATIAAPERSVLFEVDLQEFNEFSAKVDNESVLLSCYNIYEFQKFRREGANIIVSLRVSNYHNLQTDGVINTERIETNPLRSSLTTLLQESDNFLNPEIDIDNYCAALERLSRDFQFTPAPRPVRGNPRSMNTQLTVTDDSGVAQILAALNCDPKKIVSLVKSSSYRPSDLRGMVRRACSAA